MGGRGHVFTTVSLRRGGAGQGIDLPPTRSASASSSSSSVAVEADAGPRFSTGYTAGELTAYYRGRPHLVLRRLVTLSGAALRWLAAEALERRDGVDGVEASRRRAVRATRIPTVGWTRPPSLLVVFAGERARASGCHVRM
jgi:hypothetical protein